MAKSTQVPDQLRLAARNAPLAHLWPAGWNVFWAVVVRNALVPTGAFDDFRRWLICQGTADIRAGRRYCFVLPSAM